MHHHRFGWSFGKRHKEGPGLCRAIKFIFNKRMAGLSFLLICGGSISCSSISSVESVQTTAARVPAASSPASEPESLTSLSESGLLFIFLDSSHRARIQNAIEMAIEDCMRADGFTYKPFIRALDVSAYREKLTGNLLQNMGAYDREIADQYGYGLPPFAADEVDPPQNPSDQAFMHRLLGDNPDSNSRREIQDPINGQVIGTVEIRSGCVGEADLKVFGSDEVRARYNALDIGIQQAAITLIQQALASPNLTVVLQAWQECMKASGYPGLRSFLEPVEREWPDPPQSDEITMAVQDVGCKESSGVIAGFSGELDRLAGEMSDKSLGMTAEWKSIYDSLDLN